MTDFDTMPVEMQIIFVENALKGPKRIHKILHSAKKPKQIEEAINSLTRHREKTYYRFMLLSSWWMSFMKKNFEPKSGTNEEILKNPRCMTHEVSYRILHNWEFVRREETRTDDGRIELFRVHFRLFEQHYWNAKNFWNNEMPALKYRRENKLDMKNANWYFHGKMLTRIECGCSQLSCPWKNSGQPVEAEVEVKVEVRPEFEIEAENDFWESEIKSPERRPCKGI